MNSPGPAILPIDIDADPRFEAALRILDTGRPWYPQTPDDYREFRRFGEGLPHADHVAIGQDGDVVGWVSVSQNKYEVVPGKFNVEVAVAPEHRHRGIGQALLDHAEHVVRALGGDHMVSWVDRHDPAWSDWAGRRGFECTQVLCDVVLDPAEASVPSPGELAERAEALGVRIATFGELDAALPDARRRFHALTEKLKHDVPSPDPMPDLAYEDFLKTFESPLRIPEAQFIALRGETWVGLSTLWRRGADRVLLTGFTGIERSERGRGLATLLKWHAVRYAKASGAPHVITDNAEENAPMRAINARVGFRPLPGTWRMERAIGGG